MELNRGTWDKVIYAELIEHIKSLQDIEYRNFNKKLIPGIDNIIGVRVPALRKIAKEIAKGNWREYLKVAKSDTYEETTLQGMLIGYTKCDFEEFELYIEEFISKINNWAICDTFCSGLKETKNYKIEIWELIKKHIYSTNPWKVRFSVVMILEYYIQEEYIEDIFKYCNNIKSDEYYVKMAISWLISICFIKFEERTIIYLKENELDDFTYNKALQKIIESNRVDKDKKNIIKNMKRKAK